MKASDVLRQAAEVIEQRGALRDKPDGERSMERAVAAYTALNGSKMEGELDGWVFMCVLKLARATAGKAHLDDYADLAGYAALAAECLDRGYNEEEDFEAFRKAFHESLDRGEKTDDGWIEWKGGENPVPGRRVRFKCRDGYQDIYPANLLFWWDWCRPDGDAKDDIVAYKVIESPDK